MFKVKQLESWNFRVCAVFLLDSHFLLDRSKFFSGILAPIRYKDSDLHWYKDGKLVQDDSRRLKKWVSSYDNSNYMELELYAIDPDDSGIYQCKRDNTVLKNVVLSVEDVNGARSFKCYTLIIHPLLLYIVLIYNL